MKSIFHYFSKICPENSSFVNLTKITSINLVGFAATEFNEIFSGRQPGKGGGLVWSKPPAHPADGTGLVPKTLENLHILKRLSARENFFEK